VRAARDDSGGRAPFVALPAAASADLISPLQGFDCGVLRLTLRSQCGWRTGTGCAIIGGMATMGQQCQKGAQLDA
jgi:hypothetical protein